MPRHLSEKVGKMLKRNGGDDGNLPPTSQPKLIWKTPDSMLLALSHPAGAARREILLCTAARSGQGRAR